MTEWPVFGLKKRVDCELDQGWTLPLHFSLLFGFVDECTMDPFIFYADDHKPVGRSSRYHSFALGVFKSNFLPFVLCVSQECLKISINRQVAMHSRSKFHVCSTFSAPTGRIPVCPFLIQIGRRSVNVPHISPHTTVYACIL